MPHQIIPETPENRQRQSLEDMMEAQHQYLQWLGNRFLNKEPGPLNPEIFLDEFTLGNNTSQTSLTLTLNIDNPILVQSIITGFGGTSAILQIGDRYIPLTPSMPSITGIALIMYKTDKVILTGQASGSMFIELMGRVFLGTKGWNRT